MSRIGIDVGGTNTDAVLLEGGKVLAALKRPTTVDVADSVRQALVDLVAAAAGHAALGRIEAVMIGTTHFTNVVVERRHLDRIAALRIGLPANAGLPRFIGWPKDLAAAMRGSIHMVGGGHEYDGRVLMPLDRAAVRREAQRIASHRIADSGISSVAITSVFSPLTDDCEREAAEIVREVMPAARITLSHEIGRIGLLERENAALLNAGLQGFAQRTTTAFVLALRDSGIAAPLHLTQYDGTIVQAAVAERHPVYCFASGPTNSLRGAAFLSGLTDALVVDVGATTTDVGCLKGGFPRQANAMVEIGGVRTLFRMSDLISIGLGGGTEIPDDGRRIGPDSVGFRLPEKALCFGGGTLTATDIAVAAGRVALGEPGLLGRLPVPLVADSLLHMEGMVADVVDRMKTDATPIPLIAVGGGSFLAPDRMEGVSEVDRIEHHAVANAVGAAIAEVSGEVDRIFSGVERDAALEQTRREATPGDRGGRRRGQRADARCRGHSDRVSARQCAPRPGARHWGDRAARGVAQGGRMAGEHRSPERPPRSSSMFRSDLITGTANAR